MVSNLNDIKIAVVGLGYVGLPLAVAFGKSRFAPVLGFDKSQARVEALLRENDFNNEISGQELKSAKIEYTIDSLKLKEVNFIIVAVPTPITLEKKPDLDPIKQACKVIGENLKHGTVVVFESTVYPGVTEEICIPIIEDLSGLKCGQDWKVGYSPERINPGDKEHTLEKVIKVVSGMDQETLEIVAEVYGEICKAGLHKAPNIKTAEASKVIENIQRDLNIALINEFALIFQRMKINTREVLEAAGTKWNFHKYQPGAPGGHCISVDPYYLTCRAEELGYVSRIISAGRRVNEYMPEYIAELMIQGLLEADKNVKGARVLVLGLTFKEDIRDTRNSKIAQTIQKLQDSGIIVLGYDPQLTREEVEKFGVEYVDSLDSMGKVNGIILAVVHNQFKKIQLEELVGYCGQSQHQSAVLVDIKSWFLPVIIAQNAQKLRLIYKCL